MSVEDYAKHFTALSDRRLIGLVENPNDIDPAAVKAAEHEFARRGLSEQDIVTYREETLMEDVKRLKYKERVRVTTERVRAIASKAHETVIADPDETHSVKRQVRIMLIASGIIMLILSPRFLDIVWLADGGYDLSTLEHFLPLLLLPATMFWLWKKRRTGWFTGTIITTWSFAQAVASGWVNWSREASGIEAIDMLFPAPNRSEIVTGILFAMGLAAAFQLRKSMEVFKVTPVERWLTVIPPLLLVLWRWSPLLAQ